MLDAGWLAVGHVDEFVQFLPANTPRGWRIGLTDPELGLNVLRQAQRAGHGGIKMFSIPSSYPTGAGGGQQIPTIAQMLANSQFQQANSLAARKIDENLQVLRRETGITDAEIVRIPALFKSGWKASSVVAYVPDAVNGVVLSPTTYLAPRQWGPQINGSDVFAAAVTAAYAGAGITVRYLDDRRTHHLSAGEVHCGTNTIRDATQAWWPRTTKS